ncbi:MAG: hypothetical protein NTX61_07450 [Bacteroidetes bacterium]|nr:hypothetical protein [Bacteroidota bacterium]
MSKNNELEKLNGLFGSYKAEWLSGKIFDLFAEPSYFPELKDNRPCVLEGGRGTGKTTVLRGLSYQGQFALTKNDIVGFDKSNFIGLYHRVDTNQVRSFAGGGISDEVWMKIFAHYFNLFICREILVFLKWHDEKNPEGEQLGRFACDLIARSLNIIEKADNQDKLLKLINYKIVEFQSKINSSKGDILSLLSMSGVPITIITEQVLQLSQYKEKIFFILIDEYENYDDYQQQIINTLIKHTTEYYTFKIGVRELGWRIKHTLNTNELLHDPADYVLIRIEKEFQDSYFSEFAKNVCQQRISQLFSNEDESRKYDIENALESITIEKEAILLGVDKTNYLFSYEDVPKDVYEKVKHLPELYLFLLAYWAKWHDMSLTTAIIHYTENTKEWDQRYENYKYEMLFKIHKGRGKVGIQKYYAGWNTYIKLSQGNIRYLMELIYRAYEIHINDEEPLHKPVSVKNQTIAAQETGEKNLMELEGLSKNGSQLIKLLLGFGRIFNVLSSVEGKFAPERNQFSFENSESLSKECQDILTAAIMHLAFIRIPGNKLTDASHTREYIYTVHPIYAAFFVFSHRRKRKLTINQEDFLGIINKPKERIKSILERYKVPFSSEAGSPLPKQLSMFENYFND